MINYVQFFPTLRCNQNCHFCFMRGINSSEFPEEEIEKFTLLLTKNEIKEVDILGGEPFVYKGLEKLVSLLLKNNIEVTISTNGTLLSNIRNFLYLFNNDRVHLGISINTKINNDLLELIKDYRLWIKTVIRKDNPLEKQIIDFSEKYNIPYYLIYFDAITPEDLQLSSPFYEYFQKIKKLQSLYKNIKPVYCKGFINGDNYRCPAGTEKITIMPNGDVYPCYLLIRYKDFCLGNIFTHSLKYIMDSPILRIFKDFRGNPCKKQCKLSKNCHGGCVAHSIIHYKNPYRADPRCSVK
ncbi:MAG: radical SAM protein [Thermodesulfovibrio sp.]|nr:radical SAM protein [Thermodesulfovibrio sp.]